MGLCLGPEDWQCRFEVFEKVGSKLQVVFNDDDLKKCYRKSAWHINKLVN
jgi:hypothetical protein